MNSLRSIQFRFVLAMVLVSALIGAGAHFTYFLWLREDSVQILAARTERGLFSFQLPDEDRLDLSEHLVRLVRRYELAGAALLRDSDGQLLVNIGIPLAPDVLRHWTRRNMIRAGSKEDVALAHEGDVFLGMRRVPLPRGGAVLLVVAAPTDDEQVMRESLYMIALITFAGSLAIALGLGYLLRRSMVTSVQQVSGAMERVAEGSVEPLALPRLDAELQPIAASFNSMVRELAEHRARQEEYQHGLQRKIAEVREELHAREAELMQAAKLASVGQLATGVAHEINNPIHYITLTAGILQEDLEDPEARRRVEQIVEQARRCSRIVRDLLDYSRSGVTKSHDVDVVLVLQEALELLRGQGLLETLSVTLQAADNLPQIRGTPEELSRAFYNILHNAVQAAGPEGRVWIGVNANAQRDVVEVIIEDNGPGMTPEVQDRIFEPFFTTKQVGQGTGLGLSIAYGIFARHRGRIAVRSAPGAGTTVTVRLPLRDGAASSTQLERIG